MHIQWSNVMPKTYPTVKIMHKSFKIHPIYGYKIECWEFEPVVKYWSGETRRTSRGGGAQHIKNSGR